MMMLFSELHSVLSLFAGCCCLSYLVDGFTYLLGGSCSRGVLFCSLGRVGLLITTYGLSYNYLYVGP